MTTAIVHSRAMQGIEAPAVTIEVHLARGLPGLNIVGLPEKAVKESKDRVKSAMQNSGFDFPPKRFIVNLAPADLPKEGGRFDLPIALGVLAATGQIPTHLLNEYEIAGELALTGKLRAITGALPFAIATKKSCRSLIVPFENAEEASLVRQLNVYASNDLSEVVRHLQSLKSIELFQRTSFSSTTKKYPDLKDIIGQHHGKRALEIAAAGGHSVLFSGPPGTGKTMLASRLPGIMPPMQEEHAIEVAAIYSISRQGFKREHWGVRPFRAPHHTASAVALVGGGNPPKPGEISLSHGGVLFLDELPEYSRHVLDSMREPMESGLVTISRASHQATFPAKFQLVAAMNPCPCGYLTDPHLPCQCTEKQVQRYQSRLSGPLLDRIDLHVEIPPLAQGELLRGKIDGNETSHEMQSHVMNVYAHQYKRTGKVNVDLTNNEIREHCSLDKTTETFMEKAMRQFNLSARGVHRLLRVTRTIADLDCSDKITLKHLQEALSYRQQKVLRQDERANLKLPQ